MHLVQNSFIKIQTDERFILTTKLCGHSFFISRTKNPKNLLVNSVGTKRNKNFK